MLSGMLFRPSTALCLFAFVTACASSPEVPKTAKPSRCVDEAACRAECKAGSASACERAELFAPRPAETPSERVLRLCEAGNAASCYDAGVMAVEGRDVPQDLARGKKLFIKACDGGHGDACETVGLMVRDGKGQNPNPGDAIPLFEKGCKAGAVGACAALAAQLESGLGIADRNPGRAISLNDKACAAKHAGACFALGDTLESGRAGASDLNRASAAFRAGCALGHGAACFHAGQLGEKGKGLPADMAEVFEWYVAGWSAGDHDCTRAAARLRLAGKVAFAKDPGQWDAKLFEAACALDDQAACVERGWQLRGGSREDIKRAAKLGAAACERGVAGGCILTGFIVYSVEGNADVAESFFARGCLAGNQEACARQGVLLAQCVPGGPCDAKAARPLLQTACAQRIDFACGELAALLRKGNAGDRAAVPALLDRSCELGNAEACYEAAVGAKHRHDARAYFERGCTLADKPACFELALMLERGDGGQADLARAHTVMEQQCQPVPRAQWGDACSGWCARHPTVAFCR